MTVTTPNPLYSKFKARWDKATDVYDGQAAVKRKGELYLHRTGGQIAAKMAGEETLANDLYKTYVHRAQLPDIVTPSIIGLTALAARTPWEIEVPPAMEYLRDNASAGITLEGMQSKLIHEGLKHGRLGHFVDTDRIDGKVRISLYSAPSITNWKEDYNRCWLVVLEEQVETGRIDDIFSHDYENHYRVLLLERSEEIDPNDDDVTNVSWTYRVRVYTPEDESGQYQVLDENEFSMEGFQEGELPFVFQGSTGLESDPDIIPLEGMIDHCLKYYELSADLYHDIHVSNTSTLVAFGFEEGDLKFAGAGAAIITSKSKTDADVKYVSTDGTGQASAIAMMDKQIESAEKQSHRMTDKTAGVEASSTLSQKLFTKTATLRSVEEQAVAALERDLRYIARMLGLSPESVSVKSQYKYTEKEIDATILKAISDAAAIKTLPSDAAVAYVKSNNMYPDDTLEQLMDRIEQEVEDEAAETIGMGETVEDDAFGEAASVSA